MLAIVATVLSGVVMVTTAVATGIPYWAHASAKGGSASMGLWKTCVSQPGIVSACISYDSLGDVAGWLEAVRAFEILGILASAVALGLGILNLIKKDNYLLLRVAYICSFVAGAFILLGAIVWAIKWEDATLQTSGLNLYVGFGLAIAAGIGAKVAGWCYVIGVRQQIIQPGITINKY